MLGHSSSVSWRTAWASWPELWHTGCLRSRPAGWHARCLTGWMAVRPAMLAVGLLATRLASWPARKPEFRTSWSAGWLSGLLAWRAGCLVTLVAGRLTGCRFKKLEALGRPCDRSYSAGVQSNIAQQMFISVSCRCVFFSQPLCNRRNSKHTIGQCWRPCVF